MNEPDTHQDPEVDAPVYGDLDFTREEATYQREKARLVREHLGKIAMIRGDNVVGVYRTVNEAILDGYHRFGDIRMIFKEICESDTFDMIGRGDINDPSFKRLD
jgi:hypothetical protein